MRPPDDEDEDTGMPAVLAVCCLIAVFAYALVDCLARGLP